MTATPEMPEIPDAPDPARLEEQLVAYIDGELDEDAHRELEALLSSDPALRERLEQMNQAWQMLDLLDRPDVDDTFTETTLELVAVAAESDAGKEESLAPWRRWRGRVALAGSVLAATAAGFLAVALVRPDPDRELLKNLPVLEHFDEYRRVESVEFLRELHKAGLFTQDLPDEP